MGTVDVSNLIVENLRIVYYSKCLSFMQRNINCSVKLILRFGKVDHNDGVASFLGTYESNRPLNLDSFRPFLRAPDKSVVLGE